MIEKMSVGAFIEAILSDGLLRDHCNQCIYWKKRGCSHDYVDCYHLQHAMVEAILSDRQRKRECEYPIPEECINCQYGKSIRPCVGWCVKEAIEVGGMDNGI